MVAALLGLWLQQPRMEQDVVYGRVGDTELRMDIYHPAESGPRGSAAVVLIHGGTWISGKRQEMATLARLFAQKGTLAATVDYRLAPKHRWPAMLDDVQTAVRFLRSKSGEYGFESKRIGAAGACAGGQLALLLGSLDTRDRASGQYPEQSSKVAAVFDLYGPTDLTRDFSASADNLLKMLFGKPRGEVGDELRGASPLFHVTKDSAPTYILQGLDDPFVNPNQSRYLVAKLEEFGVPVTAAYVDGLQHELPYEKNSRVRGAVERGVAWLIGRLVQ